MFRALGESFAACGEPMSVALVVGGTIVIPHMRRAIDFMDEMLAESAS
jgi:hypothetical protein